MSYRYVANVLRGTVYGADGKAVDGVTVPVSIKDEVIIVGGKAQKVRKAAQFAVLVVLAEYANDDTGRAWPAVETIADEARLPQRTVRRVLTALEQGGHVRREFNKGTGTEARYRSNAYQLTFTTLSPGLSPRQASGVTPCPSGGTQESSRGDATSANPIENHQGTTSAPGVTQRQSCGLCKDDPSFVGFCPECRREVAA